MLFRSQQRLTITSVIRDLEAKITDEKKASENHSSSADSSSSSSSNSTTRSSRLLGNVAIDKIDKLLKYSHQDFERALGKGWSPAIMQRLQEAKAFETRIEELLSENESRDLLIRQLNEKLKAAANAKIDLNAKVTDLEEKLVERGNTECALRVKIAEADKKIGRAHV